MIWVQAPTSWHKAIFVCVEIRSERGQVKICTLETTRSLTVSVHFNRKYSLSLCLTIAVLVGVLPRMGFFEAGDRLGRNFLPESEIFYFGEVYSNSIGNP